MKLEYPEPAVGAAYLGGNGTEGSILFGCFPEVNKWLASRGWSSPHTVVLPDVVTHRRLPQLVPEFLFYGHIFREGNFDFAEMRVKKPLRFIGTPAQLARARVILDVSYLGCEPHVLDRIRPAKEIRPHIEREGRYFALKDPEGRVIPIDEYIDLVPWEDGAVALPDGTNIAMLDTDLYEVERDGERQRVALSRDGDQPPVWTQTYSVANVPHKLGLNILGSYDGFDEKGPSTSYLLHVGGHRIGVDCAPYVDRILEGMGIDPESIDGFIVTHVHEDHTGGLGFYAFSTRRMKIWTTPEIWRSLRIKLGAALDLPAAEIDLRYEFVELPVDRRMALYGATVEAVYSCHAVPTIGLHVRNGNANLTITGDVAGLDYLRKMLDAGAIDPDRHDRIVQRVYRNPGYVVADAGEALIHGYPDDYRDVGRRHLFLSHRSSAPVAGDHVAVMHPSAELVLDAGNAADADIWAVRTVLAQWGIQETDAGAVLDACVVRQMPAGTVMIAQGEPNPAHAFVISHGLCSVYVDDIPVARLRPGEYFGEAAFISPGGIRNADVRADTPVRLVCIQAPHVRDLFDAAGAAGQRVADHLARIAEVRGHLQQAPPLGEMPVRLLNALGVRGTEYQCDGGDLRDPVITRGGWFVNLEGVVRMGSRSDQSREYDSQVVLGPEFAWPIDDPPKSIEAIGSVRLLRLPDRVFRDYVLSAPRVRDRLYGATIHYDA